MNKQLYSIIAILFCKLATAQHIELPGIYLLDKGKTHVNAESMLRLELYKDSTYFCLCAESGWGGGYADYGTWKDRDRSLFLTSADSMAEKRFNGLQLEVQADGRLYIPEKERAIIKTIEGTDYFIKQKIVHQFSPIHDYD
ncbi:MAG: hypothetical protein KJ607_01710 [Bacteroidetes bacterium]|nr:hypothetical protein [Bacteroidota bacterium]